MGKVNDSVKERNIASWNRMFEIAKLYYEQFGNLLVTQKCRVLVENGILEVIDKNDPRYDDAKRLGEWIALQRQKKKEQTASILTREEFEKLNSIGMIWDVHKARWDKMYEVAKLYYHQFGNLLVTQKCRVLVENGALEIINENDPRYDDAVRLGIWISIQRDTYSTTLSYGRIIKLSKIGMVWNIRDEVWETYYRYAKKYYETIGNLNVNDDCRILVENGVLEIINKEDSRYNDAIRLGEWIRNQRIARRENKNYRRKEQKLNELEMIWHNPLKDWDNCYEIAKKYYDKFGNLNVSAECRVLVTGDTLEIIDKNDPRYNDSFKLGKWLEKQRRERIENKKYGEKEEKLNRLEMSWGPRLDVWNTYYEMARKYYNQFGNLKVPFNCRVLVIGDSLEIIDIDDPRYDNAFKLGEWIKNQRSARKKNKNYERKEQRLNELEMIWDVTKDNFEVKKLLCECGIKVTKRISNKSYAELYSKIHYLLDNNLPLVTESGAINEMFFMSDVNMQVRYNVSLKELIGRYMKEKPKEKKKCF